MKSNATYLDLKSKTFVVTGAASGMGRSLSLQLAAQGSNLGLLDLKAPDAVAEEITNSGGKALAVPCNVQEASAVDTAFKTVFEHFGRLDGAANMAGISGSHSIDDTRNAIDTLADADWDRVVNTNLDGVKNCMRAEVQLMKKAGTPGSIINAASIAGQQGHPFASPYNASKWGVIGITKCVAQETATKGIRVNAIAPGVVESPFTAALGSKEDLNKYLGGHVAMNRFAPAQEITKVILFLLSDESSYMTGSVVNVDGGWS